MNHVRLVAGNAEYDVQFIFTGSSLLYLSLPANIIGGVCGSSVKQKKNYKLFQYTKHSEDSAIEYRQETNGNQSD